MSTTYHPQTDGQSERTIKLAMAGNMLTNESRIMSMNFSKLKDDFVLLKRKNGSLEHEISKLKDNPSKARNSQDVEGSQLIKDLRACRNHYT
ncbi:hypothetical protein Tco_0220829 [Tanacetum coccineum]